MLSNDLEKISKVKVTVPRSKAKITSNPTGGYHYGIASYHILLQDTTTDKSWEIRWINIQGHSVKVKGQGHLKTYWCTHVWHKKLICLFTTSYNWKQLLNFLDKFPRPRLLCQGQRSRPHNGLIVHTPMALQACHTEYLYKQQWQGVSCTCLLQSDSCSQRGPVTACRVAKHKVAGSNLGHFFIFSK